MKKLCVNIFCLFIPHKKLRHKVRDRLNLFRLKHLFIKKIRYDFVFSMGDACFVTDILKLLRLRKFSGPFDWMYSSCFETRMQFFIDEFDNYFNKEDLCYVSDTDYGKSVYKNTRTGLIYNHDFLMGKTFEEQYIEIYTKYQRRIKRIIDVLNTPKTRVLICYCERRNTEKPVPTETLIYLTNQANKVYDNKVDLIYFRHNPQYQMGKAKKVFQNEHLRIIDHYGCLGGNPEANPKEERLIRSDITNHLAWAKLKNTSNHITEEKRYEKA